MPVSQQFDIALKFCPGSSIFSMYIVHIHIRVYTYIFYVSFFYFIYTKSLVWSQNLKKEIKNGNETYKRE